MVITRSVLIWAQSIVGSRSNVVSILLLIFYRRRLVDGANVVIFRLLSLAIHRLLFSYGFYLVRAVCFAAEHVVQLAAYHLLAQG